MTDEVVFRRRTFYRVGGQAANLSGRQEILAGENRSAAEAVRA
jgi:hypothetical protein